MTAHDRIGELLRYAAGERAAPIVSVYLNITPPRPYVSELRSLLHEQRTALDDGSWEPRTVRAVKEVFDKIVERAEEIHLAGGIDGARLLVIFADPEGYWQEFHLPVGLPSRVVVDPDPYVRPLSVLLDEFPRYLVVVADAEKARIFTLMLGELEEHAVDGSRPVWARRIGPQPAGTGVWHGSRQEREIEDHVHRHLRKVAELAFDAFGATAPDAVIVGGPEEDVLPFLVDHLHSYLQERLAGTFDGRPDQPLAEIRERAVSVATAHERQREQQLLERLAERAATGGRGVVGVGATARALMMGAVHTLIVAVGRMVPGHVCPADHHLTVDEERCPLCGGETRPVDDIIDEMVEEAIAQRAEVEHVFGDHELLAEEPVGAILRFPVS